MRFVLCADRQAVANRVIVAGHLRLTSRGDSPARSPTHSLTIQTTPDPQRPDLSRWGRRRPHRNGQDAWRGRLRSAGAESSRPAHGRGRAAPRPAGRVSSLNWPFIWLGVCPADLQPAARPRSTGHTLVRLPPEGERGDLEWSGEDQVEVVVAMGAGYLARRGGPVVLAAGAGDSVAEVDVTELDPLAGRGGLHGGAGRLGLRRQRYPAVVVEVLRLGGMAGQVLRRDGLAVHRQRGGLADVSR